MGKKYFWRGISTFMISRNISSVFRVSLHTWLFLEKLHDIKIPFLILIQPNLEVPIRDYTTLYQWSANQYLGIGKYHFILQILIIYRFMENSLISISMISIKKYILIYWYFQYFTVPFLKSHESFISRVFMKFNTPEASSTHSERLFIGEN